jgi:hypothetical protein
MNPGRIGHDEPAGLAGGGSFRCALPPFRVRAHRATVRSRDGLVPASYLNLRRRLRDCKSVFQQQASGDRAVRQDPEGRRFTERERSERSGRRLNGAIARFERSENLETRTAEP